MKSKKALPPKVAKAWNIVSRYLFDNHIVSPVIEIEVQERIIKNKESHREFAFYYIYIIKDFRSKFSISSNPMRISDEYFANQKNKLLENINNLLKNSFEDNE